jgi:hypothetical protein
MMMVRITPNVKRYPTVQSFKCSDCDELCIEALIETKGASKTASVGGR